MRVYLILGLLVTATYAEKKINLDDIEKDNLRAESKSTAEKIRADETKYTVHSDVIQQQYQIPNQYNAVGGHSESYIPPQQLSNEKYAQVSHEEYVQPNQYAVHEEQYKQSGQILHQSIPHVQYYSGYQSQGEAPAKSVVANAFESHKLNYQPEVVVGNHVQSVQQKTATEKYTKAINKEPLYFDVPMAQLLSYYPHLDINSVINTKSTGLAQATLHPLTNDGIHQQISIPVYTPVYNQKQLVSSAKRPYQHSSIVPVTFMSKVPKGSTYTLPVVSKKLNSSPLLTTSLYVQPQQVVAQGRKLLYTQAYVTPSQPQYVQQLIYAQPSVLYGDSAATYNDLYTRIPAYIQDNSLRGQPNQYRGQQQLYVTPTIDHESPKEILQEQIGQNLPLNYVKIPEEPKDHFVPPQLPAQDFKSGVTQLEPVSFEEEPLSIKDHPLPSEPRSLLDTYIPSKIIAAQDTARYRERPIKLEGGFLPSKVNFALKKRKSE